MNRDDFQRLSSLRIKEAEILLQAKMYSGSYYLAGYSVECALKARISKFTQQYDFPNKSFSNKIYTHNLKELMIHARLKDDLDKKVKIDKEFFVNWNNVKDWDEDSRYEVKSDFLANDLYESITNKSNGILKWIQEYW